MADTSTSKFPRLPSAQELMAKFKFSLPSFNIGAKLWDNFVEGFAPNRRNHDACYFPLVHKNVDGSLTYFGTFVPDLFELARANGSSTAFQDAILLPKKAYPLLADGTLAPEDLRSVASQVSKKMFDIANESRKNQENLNIYVVDRIPAADLYFNAESGVAQSVAAAKAGDLIHMYGGAKGTTYQLGHIKESNREKLIHASLNWLSRVVALMAGIGAGLAFASVSPYVALLAGLTTYYITSSSKQFSFWDKAEDLIKNNWLLSAKHRNPKKIDFVKLGRTLAISAMVGFLALEGGMGAYAGAMNVLTTLPSLAGVLALGSNALLGVQAFAGVLAATAGLGAFRGLMYVMHNWLALGYAKTVITPEERAALPVDKIVEINANANTAYADKDAKHQVRVLSTKVADTEWNLENNAKEIVNLKAQLKQAQNPCVSKVVALEAIFKDLVAKKQISGGLDDASFDAAFKQVTALLPMNLGAWAPAKVFNDLSQEEKLKAIEIFKSKSNSRFDEYKNSPDFQAYLTSPRYDLDKDRFKAYLKGETYKLNNDVPVSDCCCSKAGAQALEATPKSAELVQFSGGAKANEGTATQQDHLAKVNRWEKEERRTRQSSRLAEKNR